MKTLAIAFYCSEAGILPVIATESDLKITEMDLKTLDFELPTSIRLRSDLAALQRPEFVENMKELGIGTEVGDARENLSSTVSVHRAWDGVV